MLLLGYTVGTKSADVRCETGRFGFGAHDAGSNFES